MHKTGEIADENNDGTADTLNTWVMNEDGDYDDDDKDGDGVDDDEEDEGYDDDDDDDDDYNWSVNFDNDSHNFYNGANDYCRMNSGGRFAQDYQNAAPADKAAFDAAKQQQQQAAQAPTTADNFVKLKEANTKLNIAGSNIVADGGGPEATAAANRVQGLKSGETRLERIEASLQGQNRS